MVLNVKIVLSFCLSYIYSKLILKVLLQITGCCSARTHTKLVFCRTALSRLNNHVNHALMTSRFAELILDLDYRLAGVTDRASLARMLVYWAISAGADGAWVGHPDEDGKLIFEASDGEGIAEYLKAITVRVDDSPEGQSPSGKAWRSGKIQIIADWSQHESLAPWDEHRTRAGWRSSAAIPLCDPAGVIAIAAVISRQTGFFSTSPWPELLQHLSTILGLELHHLDDRRQLELLAYTDSLTNLPNRRDMEAQLERALSAARRRKTLLAVGMFDLDDFKLFNNCHGHDAGDNVLKQLGERIRKSLRGSDTVGRVGGDEFVILLEDLDRPEAIEATLERLHQAIETPIEINGGQVQLQASLGLAIYPLAEGGSTPGELLRLADQALYRAKSRKGKRTQWWMLVNETEKPDQAGGKPDAGVKTVPVYGAGAARLLAPLHVLLDTVTERFVETFYTALLREPDSATIIERLIPEELKHLKMKQGEHLAMIIAPELEESTHRETAQRLGRIHAAVGMNRPCLIQNYGLWMKGLEEAFAHKPLRLRLAQPVLTRRLALEVEFELEGYAEVDRAYNRVRNTIEDLAWHAEYYTDLIEGAVLALLELEEIEAATIARPDAEGVLQYEAIAGEPFRHYLEQLKAGKTPPLRIDSKRSKAQGTSNKAWHDGEIQHVLHYATDSRVTPWRDLALGLGIRSSASIPLRIGDAPVALLLIYSPYPGGYTGSAQQVLLEHLQRVLSLGLERLRQATRVQAAPKRRHYRHLLVSGGLEMFYQPVIDLKQGALVKVEALARLHENETWFTPDRFLPAFGHEDLYTLYQLGLDQTLQTLDSWRSRGLVTGISLNLPPRGLTDPRYLKATRHALAARPLPTGHHLSVEILETETMQQAGSVESMLAPWRELGIQFAQDDLGSGYSSLLRLRQIPFDVVKIDQGLVRGVAADPLRVLSFIAHMTDLAHEAGARVVVEGLESPGLIEAAAILGADFGQGYVIACPLAAEDIPAWAGTHLPFAIDAVQPRTALGVLAESIRWEQRLTTVSAWPEIVRQLSSRPCTSGNYLHEQGLEVSPLGEVHEAMHLEIARDGNLQSPTYRHLHQQYLALLIEQAIEGENRAN